MTFYLFLTSPCFVGQDDKLHGDWWLVCDDETTCRILCGSIKRANGHLCPIQMATMYHEIFPSEVKDCLKKDDLLPSTNVFNSFLNGKSIVPYHIFMSGETISYVRHKMEVYNHLKYYLDYLVSPVRLVECENWISVKDKLENITNIACDDRLCIVYEKSFFLTKRFFTFGEKLVQDDTQHIIQVGCAPLNIVFVQSEDLEKKYDHHILAANSTCSLPSKTLYILYTSDRCFFSVHVVKEGCELNFTNITMKWNNCEKNFIHGLK